MVQFWPGSTTLGRVPTKFRGGRPGGSATAGALSATLSIEGDRRRRPAELTDGGSPSLAFPLPQTRSTTALRTAMGVAPCWSMAVPEKLPLVYGGPNGSGHRRQARRQSELLRGAARTLPGKKASERDVGMWTAWAGVRLHLHRARASLSDPCIARACANPPGRSGPLIVSHFARQRIATGGVSRNC